MEKKFVSVRRFQASYIYFISPANCWIRHCSTSLVLTVLAETLVFKFLTEVNREHSRQVSIQVYSRRWVSDGFYVTTRQKKMYSRCPSFGIWQQELTFSNDNFMRKNLRVHINMSAFIYFDVQKQICNIWHVIMRQPCKLCVMRKYSLTKIHLIFSEDKPSPLWVNFTRLLMHFHFKGEKVIFLEGIRISCDWNVAVSTQDDC